MSERKDDIMAFFDKEIVSVEKKKDDIEEIELNENEENIAQIETDIIDEEETEKEIEKKVDTSSLTQDIEEVHELINEINNLTFDKLQRELKIYGYDVKEDEGEIYYLKDDKNVYPNITTVKELKEILFDEKFKDGEYKPEIKNIPEIKEKIKDFDGVKFNLEKEKSISITSIQALKKIHNLKKQAISVKPIFKLESKDIENEELFNEAVTLLEKKWDILKGIKEIEERKVTIEKKIKKAPEDKANFFSEKKEKLQFELTVRKQESKTVSEFSEKYLENKDFEAKKILKDDEKDIEFKKTIKKVLKARDFDEVKNIGIEVDNKINVKKEESLAFNTVLALCEKVINNIEETLKLAEELKEEIEKEISKPAINLINDLTKNREKLHFQQKNEKKEQKERKKVKMIKKDDTIMENILLKGGEENAKKSIRKL